MKISFLMPAFNAEHTLEKAVYSIMDQKTADDKEVIIIDDGSGDATLQVAQKCAVAFASVSVFTKPNGGEASALNYGLQKASGEFIALVEADVELKTGWLDNIMAQFDDSSVFGAGGTLITSREESWIARIAGYEVEQKFASKERYPRHITSANALYRTRAFTEAGVFNENLINASLDSDFNNRLIMRGHKLAYVRDAVAFHHYKSTFTGYLARNYSYARYRMYVNNAILYPADFRLAIDVFLSGVFLCSLLLVPVTIKIPAALLILLFLLQVPMTIKLFLLKKDLVLFVYPFVAIVKNFVAVAGLIVGMAKKYIR
jgi:glycosyltransferase involved in cell wall biosynthesis